jgi:hypothetical protein
MAAAGVTPARPEGRPLLAASDPGTGITAAAAPGREGYGYRCRRRCSCPCLLLSGPSRDFKDAPTGVVVGSNGGLPVRAGLV